MKDNYVVSDLAVIDESIELNDTTTEGATMERALMTTEWLKEHGFAFGEAVVSPWVMEEENDMRLWFETFVEIIEPEPDNVENVVDNSQILVWFEGDELVAEGEMYLFNANGQLIMRGEDRMNVVGLPVGVYVVRTIDGIAKVIVK